MQSVPMVGPDVFDLGEVNRWSWKRIGRIVDAITPRAAV